MLKRIGILLTFGIYLIGINTIYAQAIPTFGPEIKVTISGLTFDAMEPFISPDGNTLFFNSLNAGGNTNIYYALKENDSTFTFMGLVDGCYDPSPEHLDGVPAMDTDNHFFWISLRNYPFVFENLFSGWYNDGAVTDISRVNGDFYIYEPGWLIMDATINYEGNYLYFNNAYFNNCLLGMPCDARLGVAEKLNDTTFVKLWNSETLFANVNDTNYIVYAPQVTQDGLELYFTRILNGTVNSEICVSTRANTDDAWSLPTVIYANLGFVPEAATITTDKKIIYYHQKDETGIFHIYMRYREIADNIQDHELQPIVFSPNPVVDDLYLQSLLQQDENKVEIFNMAGKSVLQSSSCNPCSVRTLASGMYVLSVTQNGVKKLTLFIKQ
ncbi:MAG TPA: T9SS type A sorting domain-containing protein [Chitinophagales bacterium]|nr:T9SS type A sorting domain-containing protein [Chitinophagales bacterium]HRG86615.1 T9SS type A sorting domain-containing protein [Chitinophagales bacterium]